MNYTLSDKQKQLLKWLVRNVESGEISGDFALHAGPDGIEILGFKGESMPDFHLASFKSLAGKGYLHNYQVNNNTERFVLTGLAYITVAHDFKESGQPPNIPQETLLGTYRLDSEIKNRCLPLLAVDSDSPYLWDAVIRTACVILENRLRQVGKVQDEKRVGRDLVNDIFGDNGALASKFSNVSERMGYRELFTGMVGAVRNPYAHRFIDPQSEDARAILLFINFLLKSLDDLAK